MFLLPGEVGRRPLVAGSGVAASAGLCPCKRRQGKLSTRQNPYPLLRRVIRNAETSARAEILLKRSCTRNMLVIACPIFEVSLSISSVALGGDFRRTSPSLPDHVP